MSDRSDRSGDDDRKKDDAEKDADVNGTADKDEDVKDAEDAAAPMDDDKGESPAAAANGADHEEDKED